MRGLSLGGHYTVCRHDLSGQSAAVGTSRTSDRSINQWENGNPVRYHYALWSGLVVAALIAVAELAAAPVHAQERGQDFLGYFLGAAHLLNLPGFTIAAVGGLIPGHQWAGRGLAVAIPVSGIFWGGVVAIVIRIGRKFEQPAKPTYGPDLNEPVL